MSVTALCSAATGHAARFEMNKMQPQGPYSISLDAKFPPLELIDVRALAAACQEQWSNQTLCRVNDCVVRLGVLHGEFHWHKHDREDECFIVLEGELLLDIDGKGTVTLGRHLGYTVPKGVVHRTRALQKTIVLMIEAATVTPTGD